MAALAGRRIATGSWSRQVRYGQRGGQPERPSPESRYYGSPNSRLSWRGSDHIVLRAPSQALPTKMPLDSVVSEHLPRIEEIVGPTPKRQTLHRIRATQGIWRTVVNFHKPRLATPMTGNSVHKGATAPISGIDHSTNMSRNVSSPSPQHRRRHLTAQLIHCPRGQLLNFRHP